MLLIIKETGRNCKGNLGEWSYIIWNPPLKLKNVCGIFCLEIKSNS